MNNNIFSNKKNFKKIGISIIAILVIVTALYNVKLQSVTKYKAQQQSMVDEYNLNSEKQSSSVMIDCEITVESSEMDMSDTIYGVSDSFENKSTQALGNDNEIISPTYNGVGNSLIADEVINNGSSKAGNNPTNDQIEYVTCTIEVRCDLLSSNMSKWTNKKKDPAKIVPENGVILKKMTITVKKGSSVYDVLTNAINNITVVSKINSDYITSINQLEEKDAGSNSGWFYKVNDKPPTYGCSFYTVTNGDAIIWYYVV